MNFIRIIATAMAVIGWAYGANAVNYAFVSVDCETNQTLSCLGTTFAAGKYDCLNADGTDLAYTPSYRDGNVVYLQYDSFVAVQPNTGLKGFLNCRAIAQGCSPDKEYNMDNSFDYGCKDCPENTFSAPAENWSLLTDPGQISKDNKCGWCKTGYYFDESIGGCTQCPANSDPKDYCTIGTRDSDGNCFYYRPRESDCFAGECPFAYYRDTATDECMRCPDGGRRPPCTCDGKECCILATDASEGADETGYWEDHKITNSTLDTWEYLYQAQGSFICPMIKSLLADKELEGGVCLWHEG